MTATRFADQLNAQIGNEFAAHQQYVAIAVHYDALTMPNLAAYFYRQALEERDHAMMMVKFLLDTDEQVSIPGIAAPEGGFTDIGTPVALALAQEKRVTQEIYSLTRTARAESDFAAEQFMQWFIKEQVEEVAAMNDLLTVVTRAKDDIQYIEEYAGQRPSEHDPTAPAPAGG